MSERCPRIALEKIEAFWFHGPRCKPPVDQSHLSVNGVRIEIGVSMKYLSLVLNCHWSFHQHFSRLIPKIMGAAISLGRLLLNFEGPSDGARHLYTVHYTV